jgi:dienelactone hydrolase
MRDATGSGRRDRPTEGGRAAYPRVPLPPIAGWQEGETMVMKSARALRGASVRGQGDDRARPARTPWSRWLAAAAVGAAHALAATPQARAQLQPAPVAPQPAPAAPEEFDAELRETVHRVEVTVTDYHGRTETRPVVVTVFRPPREGRFPLFILNHGRAVDARRHLQGRQRYLPQARWLVARGFVVMVPTRIGYGETYSGFDPEYLPSCQSGFGFQRKDEAVARQIAAVRAFALAQPYVNPDAWVIAGQSVGGYVALAVARRAPEGLRGAINFSGGFGGNPDTRRGDPCGAADWERALARRNPTEPLPSGAVPTLWLYWQNDHYWGPDIPQRWHRAFLEGGGTGPFVQFGAIDGDGHSGFVRRARDWGPVVERFLATLPLALERVPLASLARATIPAPSGHARLDEVDKVPYLGDGGRQGYRAWLGREMPRAFAINADGRWGWASGQEDAAERALGFCNRQARTPCALYAVDEDVVWRAPR